MASPPAKSRAIREIRGKNWGLKHEKLTGEILGAATAVLNELKPGLDERLYENALVIELAARGLSAEQQRRYPVYYRGHFIGQLVPDPIVNGTVIVDPKVVSAFNESHLAQRLGYLNITGLEVALRLNFKEAKLAWNLGKFTHQRRSGPAAFSTLGRQTSTYPQIPVCKRVFTKARLRGMSFALRKQVATHLRSTRKR
jgi:GxxExxY protein